MKTTALILLILAGASGYLFLGSQAVLIGQQTADDGGSMTCRYFTGTGTFSATMPRHTEFRNPPTSAVISRAGRPACPRLVDFGLEGRSGGTQVLSRIWNRDGNQPARRGSAPGSANDS